MFCLFPVDIEECCERFAVPSGLMVYRHAFFREDCAFAIGRDLFVEPTPETRDWREGREPLQARQLCAQLFDNLFDQEISERDASQTGLAIAYRIEDGGVGPGEIVSGCFYGQQRIDLGSESLTKRDFDKDQRFAWKRRVEERKAAAIGCQAAPQIAPATDLVHGLICDDFFEHRCRGVPIDPLQLQEAAVEP